jgi:D-3-phosphoglycerate dehydrogenase
MLRRLNEVFLQRDINIFAQYLETDNEVGYVVLDADLGGQSSFEILDEIRELDGTIRARLIYEH